jgi:hypothetical protein
VNDQVAVRVAVSAPRGCPGTVEFETELSARTPRARIAEAREVARLFRVKIEGAGSAVVGRMTVERDGTISDARVIRGKNCREVASALALTAALSIDPQARLVLDNEPAPAAPSPPAQAPPARPEPPPPAPTPSVAPAPLPAPVRVAVRVGVGVGLVQIVTSDVMPIVSVVDEVAFPGPGPLRPSVVASLHMASNVLDGDRQATFTWIAGQLDLCPLALPLGGIAELRPCGAAQAGSLRGAGRAEAVAQPLEKYRAWESAGLSARLAARFSPRFETDLSASALVPFVERDFVFASPQRDIARTVPVAVGVSLGASYTFP